MSFIFSLKEGGVTHAEVEYTIFVFDDIEKDTCLARHLPQIYFGRKTVLLNDGARRVEGVLIDIRAYHFPLRM
jgi:hypothetical protein